MKVKQSAVGTLLTELGVKTGSVMALPLLEKRVTKLQKMVDDEDTPEPKTEESKKLLKQILKALKNDEEIEIIPSAKEEKTESPKSEKSNGKSKAKADPEDEDEDDEEEEDDDEEDEEEEEEAPKSKKKAKQEDDEDDEDEKPAKKSKKDAKAKDEDEDEEDEERSKKDKKAKKKGAVGRGPGIIKRIRDIMEKTSEKKPVTKQQIVEALKKEFPDHEEESLTKTVTGQVSYFLRKTNKKQKDPLDIQRNEKGFYVAG